MTDSENDKNLSEIASLKKQLSEISIKLEDLISRVDHQEDALNSIHENMFHGDHGFHGASSVEEYNDLDDIPPPPFKEEESPFFDRTPLEEGTSDVVEEASDSKKAVVYEDDVDEKEPELSEEEVRRQKVMSFLDHLEEFRWVLFKSAVGIAIFAGLSLYFSDFIYDLFMYPLEDYIADGKVELRYKSPLSAFMIFMKMGFTGGMVLGVPFAVYFLWGFVAPGLRELERRYVFWAVLFGCVFFLFGGFLGYLFIPMGIPFLLSFVKEGIRPDWDIETYMGFCTNLVIAFGAMFEMPVLLALLIKLDIVSSEMLKKHRPIAVVAMFVIAAMITPPDVYSQIAVALPMVFFYELGIIYAKRGERRQNQLVGETASEEI